MFEKVMQVYFEDGVDHGVGKIKDWIDDDTVVVEYSDGYRTTESLLENIVFIDD